MSEEIDLGMDMSETMSQPSQKSDGKMYPSFCVCGPKELDIPDEGVMEIRYKKIAESERKSEDGSEHYDCTIQVRAIVEVEEDEEVEPPARSGTSAEDALDKLAEALGKRKEKNESD